MALLLTTLKHQSNIGRRTIRYLDPQMELYIMFLHPRTVYEYKSWCGSQNHHIFPRDQIQLHTYQLIYQYINNIFLLKMLECTQYLLSLIFVGFNLFDVLFSTHYYPAITVNNQRDKKKRQWQSCLQEVESTSSKRVL